MFVSFRLLVLPGGFSPIEQKINHNIIKAFFSQAKT